jgi:tight adherence protein B
MILLPPSRRTVALLLALFVALAPVREAAAADDVGAQAHIVDVDTRAYPDVALTVDLPDAVLRGAPDVTVVENGQARRATVDGGGSGHLEVVLAMDTSGSMTGEPLAAAKASALAFVSQLPPGTSAAIVGFGATPYVVSPLTSDNAALQAAISGLVASGETALYDGLALAADQFSPGAGPRSIILVSDGGDTTSVAGLDAVTAKLVATRARLFGVQLVTPEANRPVLDALAAATKGQTTEASDASALAATYETVAGEAVRQIRVVYRSAAHGPTPVAVRIGAATAGEPATVALPAAPPVTTITTLPRPVRDTTPSADSPSTAALGMGATCLFVALLLGGLALFVRPRRSLLAPERRRHTGPSAWADLKRRAGARLEAKLEQRGRRDALGARLENAGVALRPGEYLVVVAAVAAMLGFVGLVAGGVGVAVVFMAVAVLAARVVITSRTGRRRRTLDKQLPDVLQQLTSSLRAGYGIMQAIDAVSHEIGNPMREELRRLITEAQLGRELSESLHAMAGRIGGEDFSWVVQAIEINREVGGDLVEVLEAVAGTIRARAQLRRQVKTLSAQGRLSARILISMPFVMAGLLSLLNPHYLAPFADHSAGPVLIAIGGALLSVGWLWLRRIVRTEF